MSQLPTSAPRTKRRVLAQLLVCDGCCCGRTENGNAPVPSDWLRAEWKKRKLMLGVDLTIPYCLGPCDARNVVCVLTPTGSTWLGHLTTRQQYEALLDWATNCTLAGELLPLPAQFDSHRFERWKGEPTTQPDAETI